MERHQIARFMLGLHLGRGGPVLLIGQLAEWVLVGVVLSPVVGDRLVLHGPRDPEALDQLNRLVSHFPAQLRQLRAGLLQLCPRNDTLSRKERRISLNPVQPPHEHLLLNQRLGLTRQIGFLQGSGTGLCDHQLAVGVAEGLDEVTLLLHHRVEQGGALLLRGVHLECEFVERELVPLLEHLEVPVKAPRRPAHPEGPAGGEELLPHHVALDSRLVDAGLEQLSGHLQLHHPVVTLSGDTRVRPDDRLSKAVGREEPLPAAPLAAGGGSVLGMPGDEGLDDTADAHELLLLLLRSVGVGCDVRVALGDVVERDLERVGVGNERHDGVTLQLVVEDRGVGQPLRPDSQTRRGVPNGGGEDHLGAPDAHRSNANPPAEKLIRKHQEPLTLTLRLVLYRRAEGTTLLHLTGTVQQRLPWHPHVVEPKCRVVDTVESDLVTHIPHLNVRLDREVLVRPDGHQEPVKTLVSTVGKDKTGEHNAVVRVDRPVGDPVLLCDRGGSVHDELVLLGVVGCGSFHLHSVVAVAQLGQAEAAHALERVDSITQLQVPVGSELQHGTTEEVELDSELGRQVSITLSAHFMHGEDVARVGEEVPNTHRVQVAHLL
eukprot:Hpha_TRINITY_DN15297_c3_g3::TRINITY_DN15297_c3_g3_i1::g.65615::m.65615